MISLSLYKDIFIILQNHNPQFDELSLKGCFRPCLMKWNCMLRLFLIKSLEINYNLYFSINSYKKTFVNFQVSFQTFGSGELIILVGNLCLFKFYNFLVILLAAPIASRGSIFGKKEKIKNSLKSYKDFNKYKIV